MYQTTTYASPVGELTLASDGTALTGLWLEGQKHFGGTTGQELAPGQPDLPETRILEGVEIPLG